MKASPQRESHGAGNTLIPAMKAVPLLSLGSRYTG
jgi:hypothetical protein